MWRLCNPRLCPTIVRFAELTSRPTKPAVQQLEAAVAATAPAATSVAPVVDLMKACAAFASTAHHHQPPHDASAPMVARDSDSRPPLLPVATVSDVTKLRRSCEEWLLHHTDDATLLAIVSQPAMDSDVLTDMAHLLSEGYHLRGDYAAAPSTHSNAVDFAPSDADRHSSGERSLSHSRTPESVVDVLLAIASRRSDAAGHDFRVAIVEKVSHIADSRRVSPLSLWRMLTSMLQNSKSSKRLIRHVAIRFCVQSRLAFDNARVSPARNVVMSANPWSLINDIRNTFHRIVEHGVDAELMADAVGLMLEAVTPVSLGSSPPSAVGSLPLDDAIDTLHKSMAENGRSERLACAILVHINHAIRTSNVSDNGNGGALFKPERIAALLVFLNRCVDAGSPIWALLQPVVAVAKVECTIHSPLVLILVAPLLMRVDPAAWKSIITSGAARWVAFEHVDKVSVSVLCGIVRLMTVKVDGGQLLCFKLVEAAEAAPHGSTWPLFFATCARRLVDCSFKTAANKTIDVEYVVSCLEGTREFLLIADGGAVNMTAEWQPTCQSLKDLYVASATFLSAAISAGELAEKDVMWANCLRFGTHSDQLLIAAASVQAVSRALDTLKKMDETDSAVAAAGGLKADTKKVRQLTAIGPGNMPYRSTWLKLRRALFSMLETESGKRAAEVESLLASTLTTFAAYSSWTKPISSLYIPTVLRLTLLEETAMSKPASSIESLRTALVNIQPIVRKSVSKHLKSNFFQSLSTATRYLTLCLVASVPNVQELARSFSKAVREADAVRGELRSMVAGNEDSAVEEEITPLSEEVKKKLDGVNEAIGSDSHSLIAIHLAQFEAVLYCCIDRVAKPSGMTIAQGEPSAASDHRPTDSKHDERLVELLENDAFPPSLFFCVPRLISSVVDVGFRDRATTALFSNMSAARSRWGDVVTARRHDNVRDNESQSVRWIAPDSLRRCLSVWIVRLDVSSPRIAPCIEKHMASILCSSRQEFSEEFVLHLVRLAAKQHAEILSQRREILAKTDDQTLLSNVEVEAPGRTDFCEALLRCLGERLPFMSLANLMVLSTNLPTSLPDEFVGLVRKAANTALSSNIRMPRDEVAKLFFPRLQQLDDQVLSDCLAIVVEPQLRTAAELLNALRSIGARDDVESSCGVLRSVTRLASKLVQDPNFSVDVGQLPLEQIDFIPNVVNKILAVGERSIRRNSVRGAESSKPSADNASSTTSGVATSPLSVGAVTSPPDDVEDDVPADTSAEDTTAKISTLQEAKNAAVAALNEIMVKAVNVDAVEDAVSLRQVVSRMPIKDRHAFGRVGQRILQLVERTSADDDATSQQLSHSSFIGIIHALDDMRLLELDAFAKLPTLMMDRCIAEINALLSNAATSGVNELESSEKLNVALLGLVVCGKCLVSMNRFGARLAEASTSVLLRAVAHEQSLQRSIEPKILLQQLANHAACQYKDFGGDALAEATVVAYIAKIERQSPGGATTNPRAATADAIVQALSAQHVAVDAADDATRVLQSVSALDKWSETAERFGDIIARRYLESLDATTSMQPQAITDAIRVFKAIAPNDKLRREHASAFLTRFERATPLMSAEDVVMCFRSIKHCTSDATANDEELHGIGEAVADALCTRFLDHAAHAKRVTSIRLLECMAESNHRDFYLVETICKRLLASASHIEPRHAVILLDVAAIPGSEITQCDDGVRLLYEVLRCVSARNPMASLCAALLASSATCGLAFQHDSTMELFKKAMAFRDTVIHNEQSCRQMRCAVQEYGSFLPKRYTDVFL